MYFYSDTYVGSAQPNIMDLPINVMTFILCIHYTRHAFETYGVLTPLSVVFYCLSKPSLGQGPQYGNNHIKTKGGLLSTQKGIVRK